jgi:protein-disulfide isomerase
MDDDATDFMDCRYDDEACFSTWLGLEQGVSADGIPTIGSDAAPIIIGEFGDFGCPHCLAFAPTFEALVRDYAGSGEAQFYYFPLAFVRGENSVIAADAAICSLDQGAFWQMHEVLFEIQATQTYEAFTVENLVTVAAGLGLDGDGLRDCMLSDQPAVVRDMAQGAGDAAGVTGTPTIVFSVDGGATWTVIEDRSEASIRSLIEGASLEA